MGGKKKDEGLLRFDSISIEQPLEDFVFRQRSLNLAQPICLLERAVHLGNRGIASRRNVADSLVNLSFACGETLALGDRLDDQLSTHLALRHGSELVRKTGTI